MSRDPQTPTGRVKAAQSKQAPQPVAARPQAHLRFRSTLLASVQVEEVRRLFVEGRSLDDVCTFVQTNVRGAEDVNKYVVREVLKEYKQGIPRWEFAAARGRLPQMAVKAEVIQRLDELQELEALYRKQQDRLRIGLAYEQKLQILSPQMNREIVTTAEILARSVELKLSMGIYQRQGVHDPAQDAESDSGQTFGSPEVQQVMDAPEARRKVIQIAERLLTLQRTRADFAAKLQTQLPTGDSPTESPTKAVGGSGDR